MSSVLRKKIEAGAGIPPKILRFENFWADLHSRISSWSLETLDGALAPDPAIRRVLPGDAARELLERRTAYYFNARLSPGLCAVAIDGQGAARIAAKRMSQDMETARESSPLFMKLLFESPAAALWRGLAKGLERHQADAPVSPLADHQMAAGMFDPDSRYLLAAFTVMPEALRAQVWVALELDYVLAMAGEAELHAASQKRVVSSSRKRALEDSVMTSTIRLEAVLDRVPMSIGECSRLNVGDIVALPETDPRHVCLCAETVNGSIEIGLGEMGVWKRNRAVKLRKPVLEPFTQEVAKM